MYIERNKLHVELIRYRKIVYFICVYFCEAMDVMQYRPPKANYDVSNTNHFGSVSDSLGRLAAATECMTSIRPCSHCYSGTEIRHKFVPAQLSRHIGARSYWEKLCRMETNIRAKLLCRHSPRDGISNGYVMCRQVPSNNDHHRRRIYTVVLHNSWRRRAPVIRCQRFSIFSLSFVPFGPRRC